VRLDCPLSANRRHLQPWFKKKEAAKFGGP
jgi:hypothetical protein